ncbi:hypothetical protein AB0D33_02075 [Streptomyces sp. NPDC048404]|uniref:hypothetical protein n=1 Tax=unclassified Streptomyces TaxID=2593676 RepID=UPI0034154CF2
MTISYRNPGKTDLCSGQASVRVLTAGGQQIGGAPALVIDGPDIAACPSAGAGDMVPPGGRVTRCTVHLLADGDEPVGVGFEDADEGDLSVWRAHVS